jgi:hypothetical protein
MPTGRALLLATVVALAARAGAAPAEPVVAPLHAPHVLHVPTAWLQPRGGIYAVAGADHRGGGTLVVAGGLAGIAELDAGITDRFVECDPCGAGRVVRPAWIGTAAFKIGLAPGALFRGQPALALGFERSFAARAPTWSTSAPRLAGLYLATSAEVAGVRLHGGATLWDAAAIGADGLALRLAHGAAAVRPFVGLEWTPAIYPRTTLLADFSWVPELGPDRIALRALGGWGVRYQALAWGAIELAVRHREGDGLAGSTVFVRVDGAWRR